MIRKGYNIVSKLALFFALVCSTVPFSPTMPTKNIDYSWAIALNQAVAQGLVFGKDIIFTLGPYACIYTKVYHPSTDGMMIFGSLYFCIFYWLVSFLLIKRHHALTFFCLIVAIFGMVYARDVLFFSYAPLLSLWVTSHSNNSTSSLSSFLKYGLLFSPFGLLMLIKGTFLLQAISFITITTVYLIEKKNKIPMFGSLIASAFSCVLFWLVVGQPISALPSYITNVIGISLSFSESMSYEANYLEIYIFLGTSLVQLLFVAYNPSFEKKERIYLFFVWLLFLFISFKAGFTRHFGHAYVASTALLFSGVILSLTHKLLPAIVLVFLSTVGSVFVNSFYTHISIMHNLHSTLSTTLHGVVNRYHDPTWPKNNYKTLMKYIAGQEKLPLVEKCSDIYSYDQVLLLASGNNWSPRPIFQSYSVFNRKLAEINKHKLEQKPPENIFFRLQPIDNKYPSLDDGASWRVLLSRYHPSAKFSDFLLLKKNHHSNEHKNHCNFHVNSQNILGEEIQLPNHTSMLYAKFFFKKTLMGKIWSLIYNPDQLVVYIQLKDGSSRLFRLSANMTEAEFLLSPLIENTSEFGVLFFSSKFLQSKNVKSIMVSSFPRHSKHWNRQYTLYYEF